MFFLDETEAELDQATRLTIDPAVYGGGYDIPHPWETYSLIATAPVGTTQIKVEFTSQESSHPGSEVYATGSVGFDDASLIVVPEPGVVGLLCLGSLVLLGYRSRRNG